MDPSTPIDMRVVKRNGSLETVSFDKILQRIRNIKDATNIEVNVIDLVITVIKQLKDRISTTEIDELLAQQCASLSTTHVDYNTLAGYVIGSSHQKNTLESFAETMHRLYTFVDSKGNNCPLISDELHDMILENGLTLDAMCDYNRDFLIDYFGFKTLERGYLLKIGGKAVERVQHLWLRVACGIHGSGEGCLAKIKETYDYMSLKYFTHATPTLFNAGTQHQQMSSCFLEAMESDSIEGIFKTATDCAMISKWAGGIGVHIHNIRAAGSLIRGTNGRSNGIIPMLRVFNETANYANQGGKRNGSFAIYLEPWHADIEGFLKLRTNHGDEKLKARDLFYALWIPDLFMRRVKDNKEWTLMCPDECPGLSDVYGTEFDTLYERYESEGRGRRTVPARDIWKLALESQMETGNPYMLYKDSANRKSNQKNIGVIKSSNLCVAPETLILTDKGHKPISELVDQTVSVWNGAEFSEVTVRQTGVDQPLIEVHCCDNVGRTKVLTCTPYHKFYVYGRGEAYPNEIYKLQALDLHIGDRIERWHLPDSDDVIEQTIVKIVDNGRRDNTFCFNEPKRHAGIFGGIRCGNCCEIMEVSTDEETAVCNLASIALPTLITNQQFDFDELIKVTRIITYNLNQIIDRNFYPIEKAKRSNMRHRPIGIGIQGLADVFIMMDLSFDSQEAKALNVAIFEAIYYGALLESCNLAKQFGAYETFAGSPASFGTLQFDMWSVEPSSKYDWASLKADIIKYGLRNSLLVAPMPTASTSQILGFNECIEPITSNIYSRGTLAGDFMVINKYLMRDMMSLGLWNKAVKDNIIANNGSIQQLPQVPQQVKNKYKTAWELSMRTLIDMAADRAPFVCQSQSLNLWVADPTSAVLTSMHFYAWQKGLKTGIYYLRSRAKHEAQQFSIEPEKTIHHEATTYVDDGANEEGECLNCSA
jgi:ribonucleotide reductase alpha subunit